MVLVVTTVMFLEATVNHDAPSTARSLARDPRVLVGWPLPWLLVWAGVCYWHGVGVFMFN